MVNRIWPTAVAGKADSVSSVSASACHIGGPNSVNPGQILLVYGRCLNLCCASYGAPLRHKGERVVTKTKAGGLKFFEAFKLSADQVLSKVYLAKVSSNYVIKYYQCQLFPSTSTFPSSSTGNFTLHRCSQSFKVKKLAKMK